jgi:DNA-binding NarL/FixJ family response regulator
MSTAPTVVLVVDDHPLIRCALREVVSCAGTGCIEIVEAANPLQGLALLEQREDLDLVLLDLNFSGHDGLAYVERYRAAAPLVPVIVYTVHEDAATLTHALARGAVGIIPKTHSPELVRRAIRLVMDGGVYMPPQLARQLARSEPAPKPSGSQTVMSEQQLKILELLAQGMPNKTIARKLGLAPSTVKNRLTTVFERLGVVNRTQAAVAARAIVGQAESSAH